MREVEICSVCHGEGNKWEEINYKDKDLVKCNYCNGSGRVIRLSFQKVFPFNTDETRLNKIDENVHKSLRE